MAKRRFQQGSLGAKYSKPQRPSVTSRRDEAKAPSVPKQRTRDVKQEPPAAPKVQPPQDFGSRYAAGMIGFNALPEVISRISDPALQFAVNRGPRQVQKLLLRKLGTQLGQGLARVVDTGIMRGLPIMMLAGIRQEPKPGLYGIPEVGTLDYRKKYGMGDPASLERWQGISSQYNNISKRRFRAHKVVKRSR